MTRGPDIRRVVIDVDVTGRHPLLAASTRDVARMTRPEREERVIRLITESRNFYARGLHELVDPKERAGTAILYSGGNDSTTLAHMFRKAADYAIHANTGIGIEATREFVRDTCATWGLPLIERHPPAGSTYREMVLSEGFPGPGKHFKMFSRLKERGMHAARDQMITDNRRQRVAFLMGRRRDESQRRTDIPILERRRTIVYISPLALWLKMDLNTYRLMYPDVPRNPVAENLHMSGECLCGAFAHRGELDEIGFWHPEVRAYIKALEVEALAVALTGKFPVERATWGWGAYRTGKRALKPSKVGLMCASCAPADELPFVAVAA